MHGLIAGDVLSDSVAFLGYYEYALSRIIAGLARSEGGTLVDVGANMGYFSLVWAGLNDRNNALSFEVSPRNVALLRNNVVRNGLQDRICVETRAASNATGTVHFSVGPSDQTGWGGIVRERDAGSFEVDAVKLDDAIGEPTAISVLKIDVEGADTLVLEGSANLLSRKAVKYVFFEQNPERMAALGIEPGRATRFLDDLGYKCEVLDAKSAEWLAYPR